MNAMTEALLFKRGDRELVSFATHPSKYQHWKLAVEGDVARLKLDRQGGIAVQPAVSTFARAAQPHVGLWRG